ncbi:MAG: hypothetical protein AAGG44_08645, partial [Planctomycetota bacterium]
MNRTSVRALAFLSLAFGAALCPGQEAVTRLTAPKLFPEKTLAYMRVDDVKQLKEDLGKSSLGKLGNDDKIKPIVGEFYGSLVRSAEELESTIGLNLDELLSIPSGEMAIALLPSEKNSSRVERGGEGSERSVRVNVQPAVAILLDAGEEISSVQLLLSRMEEAAGDEMVHEEKLVGTLTLHRYANPERERQQFGYFIDEGVILACSDINYLEKLAEKWQG